MADHSMMCVFLFVIKTVLALQTYLMWIEISLIHLNIKCFMVWKFVFTVV